jgi:hypothetical protein
MSEAGRERVLQAQSDGVDLVLGMPVTWGLGYALRTPGSGFDFGPRVAYWAGNGGSNSFVDLDARMSFGYVPNRWTVVRRRPAGHTSFCRPSTSR